MRTPFQRDRDRIVHATAFRRLTYKTQVFVFHEGDHYRTRLTHSLEVAQIARAIARMLGLDEDLAEALALAHDLGHPPFGHAGERALAAAMAAFGGFDHNAQSLRVVTRLERRMPPSTGSTSPVRRWRAWSSTTAARRRAPGRARRWQGNRRGRSATSGCTLPLAPAEAQAAAIADDIAYNSHDLDDGLRAGLIRLDDLADVPLAGASLAELPAAAGLETQRAIYEINRRMISAMIEDAVRKSRRAWRRCAEQSLAGVRARIRAGDRALGAATCRGAGPARTTSSPRLSPCAVMAVMGARPRRIVRDLFERYMAEPGVLPDPGARAERDGQAGRAPRCGRLHRRHDRPLRLEEHRRLFDATPTCDSSRRTSQQLGPPSRSADERLRARARPHYRRARALAGRGCVPAGLDFGHVEVVPPRDAAHGDLASNAALVLAKAAKMKPRDIAEQLGDKLRAIPTSRRSRWRGRASSTCSFRPAFWQGVVAAILKEGASYGRADLGAGEQVNVEYVRSTRPDPCTSATAAGRRSATRSRTCLPSPATR